MTAILSLVRLQHDVSFGTNEDWIDSVTFLDDAGLPIDLTGIDFKMHVRHVAADATVFITGSTDDATITASATALSFDIPLSTMTNVPLGTHVYDVVATADGHSRIAMMGQAAIFQGVTR